MISFYVLRLLILLLLIILTSSQDGFFTSGTPEDDPWIASQFQVGGGLSPPVRDAVQPPTKITSTPAEPKVKSNEIIDSINVDLLANNNITSNSTMQVNIDESGSAIHSRRLVQNIVGTTGVTLDSTLKIFYDPPVNSSHAHGLGLYVWCSDKTAKIYYTLDSLGTKSTPTFDSEYVDFEAPYIHISTPYQSTRFRIVQLIAVVTTGVNTYRRSDLLILSYYVEGSDRPNSFAFFVPGVNSNGYFLKVAIENKASARAQSAGSQEFGDFYSRDGIGTYAASVTATPQVSFLRLLDIDSDLTGFEGGIPYNTSSGKHYGVLVPWHNGKDFHGKVVRINLRTMDSDRTNLVPSSNDFSAALADCKNSFRLEYFDPPYPQSPAQMIANLKVFPANAPSVSTACITVLDLATYSKRARGFIRGFANYPYIYLSPGRFNMPVRLDMESFSLATTKFLNINDSVVPSFGGYSGGFSDGTWSCFCPHRTYVGFVGGLRSERPVDAFHTTGFLHGVMTCINATAWNQKYVSPSQVRTIDFSKINPALRGYSDAIRVGRYAYFAPLATGEHMFSAKVVRMYLGTKDVAQVLDDLKTSGKLISSIVDILDVSQKDKSLVGFLGIFNQGKYIFLVPYRNEYKPINGQRGHGNVVRVDLNIYDIDGIDFLDVSKTKRAQIPSDADEDLRGFSYGFASGKYALFIPFYNGIFSGKVCRIITYSLVDTARTIVRDPNPLTGNVQELNLAYERAVNTTGKFIAFRGGFVSLWQGALY